MYKVVFKSDPNNPIEFPETHLPVFIKEQFPKANKGFYAHILKRIVGSKIPYRNDIMTIFMPKAITELKRPTLNLGDVPSNKAPNAGANKLHNEWVVYNKKNNKSDSFTSLAAVARAMDIDYAFLYNHIKYNNCHSLGNFIFYRSSSNQAIYYAEKIKELL